MSLGAYQARPSSNPTTSSTSHNQPLVQLDETMERAASPDSDSSDGTSSTLSHITVKERVDPSRSSVGASSSSTLPNSTPPTSTSDAASVKSVKSDAPNATEDPNRRRSVRSRHSIATYNVQVLAGTAIHTPIKYLNKDSSRNVSGTTLVDKPEEAKENLIKDSVSALNMDWSPASLKKADAQGEQADDNDKVKRRKSTRLDLVKEAAKSAYESASSLGKHGRGALESSKDKLSALGRRTSLRPCSKGEDKTVEAEEPSPKKPRLSPPTPVKSSTPVQDVPKAHSRPKFKRWEVQGLYVGQDRNSKPHHADKSRSKKRKSSEPTELKKENSTLPLPMFGGERLLELGRDFKLPFDVLTRLPVAAKPEDWQRFSKNRFVGEASKEFKKVKPYAQSKCLCTPESGCNDGCINRHLQYECDKENCNIGPEYCTNRAFAELERRRKGYGRKKGKNKDKLVGNDYDFGVEVLPTKDRGYGVRSMRSFEPHQIIMEYAGEVITQEECDRRMRNEYKNNKCYYLMTFDRKLIIDATKGSIARFVNHSCDPNCEMVKWTVLGEPRVALFAKEKRILPGEELTYDYNFNPFSLKNVQQCLCGSANCRGVLGPKDAKNSKQESKANETSKAKELVAGAKRKLKDVFRGKSSSEEDKGAVKKRKIETVTKTVKAVVTKAKAAVAEPVKEPVKGPAAAEVQSRSRAERLARRAGSTPQSATPTPAPAPESTGFTLGMSGGKLMRIPSATSLTTLSTSKPGALRRPSSKLERLSSMVKKSSSLIRSSSKMSVSRRSALPTPTSDSANSTTESLPFEPLTLDFQDGDETEQLMSSPDKTAAKRPQTATSLKTAVVSVKDNVVRSVRGSRRAAAVAKMGLKKEAIDSGSTIRVILGEDE